MQFLSLYNPHFIWLKFPTYFSSSLNLKLLEIMALNSVGYLLGILTRDLTLLRLTLRCESKPPTINQNLCSVSTCSKASRVISSCCLAVHGSVSEIMPHCWDVSTRKCGHTRWALEVRNRGVTKAGLITLLWGFWCFIQVMPPEHGAGWAASQPQCLFPCV